MSAPCPDCGQPLDDPAAPGRCPNCGAAVAPARPRRSNVGVWGLGCLTVLVFGPCAGLGAAAGIHYWFPDFRPVASAPGTFAAAFPGDPAGGDRMIPTGAGHPPVPAHALELARDFPDERYFVLHLNVPPDLDGQADPVLLDAAAGWVVEADTGMWVLPVRAEESSTHDGHPARDYWYDGAQWSDGDNLVLRVVLVRDKDQARVYAAGVAGPADPDSDRVKRFFAAFRLFGPEKNRPVR